MPSLRTGGRLWPCWVAKCPEDHEPETSGVDQTASIFACRPAEPHDDLLERGVRVVSQLADRTLQRTGHLLQAATQSIVMAPGPVQRRILPLTGYDVTRPGTRKSGGPALGLADFVFQPALDVVYVAGLDPIGLRQMARFVAHYGQFGPPPLNPFLCQQVVSIL